jgi:L-threonylcarbamoyladenylate synthase
MGTLRLRVDTERLDGVDAIAAIEEAARILRGGGTVALPTETVYGLGANALDAAAVAKIFVAKERPGWDPLIVHVADLETAREIDQEIDREIAQEIAQKTGAAMLAQVVAHVPEAARRLMQAFWPGPLTLLLPRSAAVPDVVTAGRALVGVRMPAHPVALEVIRRAGVPIAAPSANRFGHTSPTTAEHVLEDLDGRIDAVVDAGPTAVGVESTVVDATVSPMIIYRPGAITLEQIREVAGPVEIYREREVLQDVPKESLPSPGVGLRHYAPRARLMLVEETDSSKLESRLQSRLASAVAAHAGEKVGLMLPEELAGAPAKERFEALATIFRWGRWSEPEELAQRLFAGLRELDAAGCSVIVCPMPSGEGIGAAIQDRLRKAAYSA